MSATLLLNPNIITKTVFSFEPVTLFLIRHLSIKYYFFQESDHLPAPPFSQKEKRDVAKKDEVLVVFRFNDEFMEQTQPTPRPH